MNINDLVHGFRVTEKKHLDELGAVMYLLRFEKNGAELVWFDRDDENMTYAIGFKTLPENDTGVFHILEHSVLNGSQKYPLKEPFVDLLKCSLQTFLNAMTYPDKTIYPVSSRNDKDFLNLINVYTDAVFHPCIYTRPETFRQEGWHFEYDENKKSLTRSGVVYSEMKGAFASVDTQIANEVMRLLFPDTCYRYNSGGHPDHIPELTYEEFLRTHQRFYHPSNAKIVLDGSVKIDQVLALLEEYLSPYEYEDKNILIGDQAAVSPETYIGTYEISEGEESEDRDCYTQSFVYGTYQDYETAYAMHILADVIAGSNDAPLKKAVLEHELAENIYIENEGVKYLISSISVKNTKESKIPELEKVVKETLAGLVKNGLDADQLIASINSFEFSMRERDFGSAPKGIVFAMSVYDTWLYGGDPSSSICFGDIFDRMRSAVKEGYFESLIQRVYLDNNHRATVILKASANLGEKKQQEQEAELQKTLESMTAEDLKRISEEADALLNCQQTPDAPEITALLPKLHLRDIDKTVKPYKINIFDVDQVTILHSPQETNGILYSDLYFDISDLTPEELPYASFLCELFCETSTAYHSPLELQALLKRDLGNLNCGMTFIEHQTDATLSKPYLVMNLSVLESKANLAIPLIREVALHSDFSDKQLINTLLKQRKIGMFEAIQGHGNSFGAYRIAASANSRGAFHEYTNGIEYFKWISKQAADSSAYETVILKVTELAAKIFTKNRLTIGVTGKPSKEWLETLAGIFPEGADYIFKELKPFEKKREGFAVPTDISFVAKGFNLKNLRKSFDGSMRVVSTLLSYNYLWNVIRVQNGAYGAGMGAGIHGDVQFTTFRDPAPANSIKAINDAGSFLLQNEMTDESLESIIIGTLGESEPVRTPRMEGKHAISCAMAGISNDQISENRRALVGTSRSSIERFAKILTEGLENSALCVVGNREAIEACCVDVIETL